MRYVFLLIIVLSYKTYSQNNNLIIVKYTHSIHLEGMPNKTSVNAILLANKNFAAYEMDFMNDSSFIDEQDGEEGVIFAIKPKGNPIIFKNLKSNFFFSKERIMSNFYLVKDNTGIFDWLLKDNYKEILGYKCQEAVVNYRGRTYIAYFTTKIQFNTGPWKFGGLPGLILSIKSVDDVFKMNANTIEIKNTIAKIENPFIKKIEQTISWDDFIALYKRKYEELQSYRDPEGGYMSIPKKNIETYIKD